MIRKIFHSKAKSITSGAIIIATASLASRVLGVLRDRILASEFGAGIELDTYYAAFRIPDTIYNLLVLGAISAGFIPVFLDSLSKDGKKKTWVMVNSMVNVMLVALTLLSIVLAIFTPEFISWITPGFSAEQMSMTVGLTRIMFLSPILLGLSSIWAGILQSFKQFFIYSLAPIFYNVGIIIGALYLVPWFGIYGLGIGVVLGACLHMVVQLPAVYESGYRYQWIIDLKDVNLRKIFFLMVPRTLSLAVNQINLFIVTFFGSLLSVGSIAIFNLANNLQSFPLGIFGISLAISAFPTLSQYASKQNNRQFIKTFSQTTRLILFFIIPASALLIVLRAQIVRVIFGAGVFGWEDTINTADALAVFSLSLFAQALIPLISRGFYAFHNTKTPFYIGTFSVIINIALALYLTTNDFILFNFSPVVGLVFAFSISQIINFILLWIMLRIKIGGLDESELLSSLFKTSIATVVMALTAHWLKYIIEPLTGTDTFFGILTQGFVSGFIGILVFFLMSMFLRSREMEYFVASLKRRLFRDSEPVVEAIEEAEK
ncbi:MAG TPA: murein biosynthesis integral membrane protein MurJ [Patescibacteria group bacterium]|nr:murein biosynthesis integral membrane protein MurJ [Patescibacteria group bacterium]